MPNPFALMELDADYSELVRTIEENGGEITPEQEAQLDTYCKAMVGKADFYVNVKAVMDMSEDYCDRMIAKFRAKKNSIDRERGRWELAMIQHLDNMGVTVQDGELGKIRLQVSESVDCVLDNLPEQYRRTKIVVEPDKTAIKAVWKRGEEVTGASKVERRYIRVY